MRILLWCWFARWRAGLLKEISVVGEELLEKGGVTVTLFFLRGGGDEAVELVDHFWAAVGYWSKGDAVLVEVGGVIVGDLFDDEGEGGPCLGTLHAVVWLLVLDVAEEVEDVVGLGGYVFWGGDGVEVAVEEGLTLVEVALVEGGGIGGGGGGRYFFEVLGVDAWDGYAHASYVHDEATVAVYADDVALKACELSCGDAEEDAVAGVIVEGLEEEAYALGLCGVDAHEGTHLGIGDLGYLACATVFAEVDADEALCEVGLQGLGVALEEDQAADGGGLAVLHAVLVFLFVVADGLVHEIGHVVGLELALHALHFAVVEEEVWPCGDADFGVFLYLRTSRRVWLCNVDALWRNGVLVGCRKRIRTIRLHKFCSTLCLLSQSLWGIAFV